MNEKTLALVIGDTSNIHLVSPIVTHTVSNIIFLGCTVQTIVLDKPIEFQLIISDQFPFVLPGFILQPFDKLGFIPHIEPNGSICYYEHHSESSYINTEDSTAVFQASVEMALETLKNGLTKKNFGDFKEDFHVFWERNIHRGKLHVYSTIEVGDSPKKIQLLKDNNKAVVFEVHQNGAHLKCVFFNNKNLTAKSGIYIPLTKTDELMPPKYDEKWDAEMFVKWLRPKVSNEHWNIITDSILQKNAGSIQYVFLGIPRKSGIKLLVGGRLEPSKRTSHPFLSSQSNWKFKFLKANRYDPESILPRGGANLELTKKKILMVGCGSVGSHAVINLVKLGFSTLTLVDHDMIKPENLYRFALGIEYTDDSKCIGLSKYLDKNYLSTKIIPLVQRVETLSQNISFDFSQFDLILSATGDPTTNFFLNKIAIQNETPLIIGWNDPYSIGGHAIFTAENNSGCYKCLFDDDGYSMASFSAKEQPKVFHKKHLGCGEVFTPYNALDSIKTAELMARLAVSYFSNKLENSEILSWKGDSSEFLNEGFNLSRRYLNQNQHDLEVKKRDFSQPKCPHCATSKIDKNDC